MVFQHRSLKARVSQILTRHKASMRGILPIFGVKTQTAQTDFATRISGLCGYALHHVASPKSSFSVLSDLLVKGLGFLDLLRL